MKDRFTRGVKAFCGQFTPAYLTKIALLTAISYILYLFCKFPLPMIFPSFLEMQFSELPAILAGFSMGPFAGFLVVVLKCLLKFPLSTTSFVGEIVDIIVGLCYVLPASIIYRKNKTRKSAVLSLCIGTGIASSVAILCNYLIAIPFYVQAFFGGNFEAVVGVCSLVYPKINAENFYAYYLCLGVLPFNLLRFCLVSLVTFFMYKRLSKILHWEMGKKIKEENGYYISNSEKDTKEIAKMFAKRLVGGEFLLLSGDLGAGKTTFTKALCQELGVKDVVTSPTFTIMKTYHGKFDVHHLDMYRIESEDDVAELGLMEQIEENDITVIEWNKFSELPGKVIRILFEYTGKNKRRIKIEEV